MNFDAIGEMVLGSRLRTLSQIVTKDAQQLYRLYGVELKPKWFPVYYYLSNQEMGKPITTIANAIGHSHPSVIKIVKEMVASGLVIKEADKIDGRKSIIVLTKKGEEISSYIKVQYVDVDNAIKNALKFTKHNLWLALHEFETLISEKSLFDRVIEEKKIRESSNVEIVAYEAKYLNDFKSLNKEWITTYFRMEPVDEASLNDPENYILDKGGKILVALQNDTVLGVCALIKLTNHKYDFELSKMAVAQEARGKGIGYLLGKAIIDLAKSMGGEYIYLESNTILKPAISLYGKLGFERVEGNFSAYERCNIQMKLNLK